MALLVWQDDLNIGIDVIDHQHMRIVEMLNHLHVAQKSLERLAVAEVIDELVDYTMSHFAFEEELMEVAGYPFCAAHKRVHEIFGKRVGEYRLRFQAGEDITDELRTMLSRWLFNQSVAMTRRTRRRSNNTSTSSRATTSRAAGWAARSSASSADQRPRRPIASKATMVINAVTHR